MTPRSPVKIPRVANKFRGISVSIWPVKCRKTYSRS
nr:MAG TPA: hypothetical protein [Caudoviricetes sp.]